MSRTIGLSLVIAGLVSCFLPVSNVHGQMKDLNPKAVEIAQLPMFCYGQMKVPNANGPAYNFPHDCGPGMNHYCPGLIHLIRGKFALKAGDRRSELLEADAYVRYTQSALLQFPECSIRGHVDATRVEIDRLMGMYRISRPKSQE